MNTRTSFLLSAAVFACATASAPALAQPSPQAPLSTITRSEVKMDLAEFRRTHMWDETTDSWVLKPEFDAPMGMKSRAQVKAERDNYLRRNRWDEATGKWVPLNPYRDMSTLTREQVKAETAAFTRWYRWDELTDSWVPKSVK